MKLYYSPGACSLARTSCCASPAWPSSRCWPAPRRTSCRTAPTTTRINPKGYVPLLELDNGERLSEGPVIVQYIADQVPAKKLAAAAGTMARYRLQEWLNFITSELHKGFARCSTRPCRKTPRPWLRKKRARAPEWVDSQLDGKAYLMGDELQRGRRLPVHRRQLGASSSAWTSPAWRNLGAFMARMAARPAVQAAMKAEGLLK